MRSRGYIVRIETGRVLVEHRLPISRGMIVWGSLAYLCYCSLPGIRDAFINFYRSPDLIDGCFAVLMLFVPLFFGVSWLIFKSGEVLCCDAKDFHFARRRLLGRWRRSRFFTTQIGELRYAHRGGNKSRGYTVLTFQYDGRTYDLLEDLGYADAEHVLKACKSLGVDAVELVDDAAAMTQDIEKRGWWVNPWRSAQDDRPIEGHMQEVAVNDGEKEA